MLQTAVCSAAERMTADEREALGQPPRRRDNLSLGAAGIGDDRRLADVRIQLVDKRN